MDMNSNLILRMQKGEGVTTINCTSKEHYNRVLARFKRKGYKQVPCAEEVKIETFPF
jgi:hypothetical protein